MKGEEPQGRYLLAVAMVLHATGHVCRDLVHAHSRRLTNSPCTTAEGLYQIPGEHRVPAEGPTVFGPLVLERRRKDPATAAFVNREHRAVGPYAEPAMQVPTSECNPAMTGVQDHKDMARRQLRDHGQPRLDALPRAVSYTHLRAHETPEHLVCRLLLEKK